MVTKPNSPKIKKLTVAGVLGVIGSILTILGFFGITGYKLCSPGETTTGIPPKSPDNKEEIIIGTNSPKTQHKSDLERNQESIPLSNATAVLVVENETVIDWPLSSTILERLQKRGVKTTNPPVFKKPFLTSGGFSNLFNGDSRQGALSQLPSHFKTGVLGKKTVTYVQNPELANLITASMTLELHVISSQNGAVRFSLSCSQKGAGFSNLDASKIAEENIMKEIETQLSKIIDSLED
jgi:hypothetical protein